MKDDNLYYFEQTDVLKRQLSAFNEGFELGEKLAKEIYG